MGAFGPWGPHKALPLLPTQRTTASDVASRRKENNATVLLAPTAPACNYLPTAACRTMLQLLPDLGEDIANVLP